MVKQKLTLAVYKDGNELLSYTPMGENNEETPNPAGGIA